MQRFWRGCDFCATGTGLGFAALQVRAQSRRKSFFASSILDASRIDASRRPDVRHF